MTPRPPRPRIPKGIWVLGFVSLLMDVSSEMVHSLLPVFLVGTLGASATLVGVIEGVGEATALMMKVFSGALSDVLRRRKTLAVAGYALSAATKPFFAIAQSAGVVFAARLADRVGKGVRGAPRDALVADLAPPGTRGAAFGLRQALDTVGAVLGPLVAVGLMLLWSNDVRAVFGVAIVPGVLAVLLLAIGVREPRPSGASRGANPFRRESLRRLDRAYWWVVGIGAAFMLARFSEAFLVLRAREAGVPLAYVPLVMAGMSVAYAATSYPFGRLADRASRQGLLALGLVVLIGSDLVLASGEGFVGLAVGVGLWGVHMGATQGLLSAMVADASPSDLRGTAFGVFDLLSGAAMLVASAVAGVLWDRLGSAFTFHAGAAFAGVALVGLVVQHRSRVRG